MESSESNVAGSTCSNTDRQPLPESLPAGAQDHEPNRRRGGQPGNQNAAGPHAGMAQNTNAWQHGRRSPLVVGNGPPHEKHLMGHVHEFRRGYLAAATRIHGTLDEYQLAVLNRATLNHRFLLSVLRDLRVKDSELSVAEKRQLREDAASYADRRDKALRELGLGATTNGDSPADILDAAKRAADAGGGHGT